jgi:hypothetical protein
MSTSNKNAKSNSGGVAKRGSSLKNKKSVGGHAKSDRAMSFAEPKRSSLKVSKLL